MIDLFPEISRGKRLTKENHVLGNVPYISSTMKNNGVDRFLGNEENVKEYSNCITIANSGSVGNTFYHPYRFVASDHVTHLKNEKLNKYHYLFIAACLNKSLLSKYSFNREINDFRLKRERIRLPIDTNMTPDFDFIEQFMRTKTAIIKASVRFSNMNDITDFRDLKDLKFEEYNLSDLFTFKRGKESNMQDINPGTYPLISAKKIDNGLKSFVQVDEKRLFNGNVISLNNDGDGGVGLAYYQPHEMAVDTHVTILKPRKDTNNYVLKFITTAIQMQKNKYSHGYSLNNLRLHKQKILLPKGYDDEPDWDFMEQYMKRQENKIINRVQEFI